MVELKVNWVIVLVNVVVRRVIRKATTVIWYFFHIYITIHNICCIVFKNSHLYFFIVIVLVQFRVLVRNGMLIKIKIKTSNLVTVFNYVIDIVCTYSLTHFSDAFWTRFFCLRVVFNLTLECTPWDFTVLRETAQKFLI